MNREFKGVWIPSELWLNSDLKIMEKIFLVEISSLDGVDGCYASNGYFSDFFDLSRTRCSAIIKSLQEKGYITIKRFYEEGKKNLERRIIRVNEAMIKSNFLNNARKLRKSVSSKKRGNKELDNSEVESNEVESSYEECEPIENISMVEDMHKEEELVEQNIFVTAEEEKLIEKNTLVTDEKDIYEESKGIKDNNGVDIVENTCEANQNIEQINILEAEVGAGKLKSKVELEVSRTSDNSGPSEIWGEEVKVGKSRLEKEKSSNNPMYIDVIGYLNGVCKTNYKHTTTKNQRLINARIKEGYNLEDFKKVIDSKHREWSNSIMKKYLRPETLFGTKFERYINEIQLGLEGVGQANEWKFRDFKNNRENKKYSEDTRTSKWSNGDNTNNRELTAEEWEWAERELF